MKRFAVTLHAALIVSLALASAAAAQTQPGGKPPAPCSAPEHRQFDFWLGDWQVEVPGKPTNKSRITRLFGACGIREEYWAGGGQYEGSSFNMYDAPRKVWHQTWVDNQGGLLALEGGMRGASMVLEGKQPGPQGGEQTSRITWTPNADGTVRQLWEISTDGGKSWTTAFDGLYRHPQAAPPVAPAAPGS
ncbi:MAG: hypothetical protein KBA72_03835 [Thermoanaerobaculia bacterium]|nr:hypothetical protein [Thermoanaerobaculia bacterium]